MPNSIAQLKYQAGGAELKALETKALLRKGQSLSGTTLQGFTRFRVLGVIQKFGANSRK